MSPCHGVYTFVPEEPLVFGAAYSRLRPTKKRQVDLCQEYSGRFIWSTWVLHIWVGIRLWRPWVMRHWGQLYWRSKWLHWYVAPRLVTLFGHLLQWSFWALLMPNTGQREWIHWIYLPSTFNAWKPCWLIVGLFTIWGHLQDNARLAIDAWSKLFASTLAHFISQPLLMGIPGYHQLSIEDLKIW